MTFSFAHRPRRVLVCLAALAAVSLSACTGEDPATPSPQESDSTATQPSGSPSATPSASMSGSPSTSASAPAAPSIKPVANLDGVKVSGEPGKPPSVQVPAPWAIAKTQSKVVTPSKGTHKLTQNSTVTVQYVGVNGRDGKVFDSSFKKGTPATFTLQGVIPGFQKGLLGQRVGSRVLIGVAPEDGYTQGTEDGSIKGGDSLVFLVDIVSANFDEATGQVVTPDAALPKVSMAKGGPDLAKPSGEAPKKLVVQPLIKGSGPKVTAKSTIQVKYRMWTWADGKLTEDAWRPQQGPLETLIEGWKQGLAGQPTGSRVMLVVPPELGYPNGNPDVKLAAGQTLVYVIDILDATDQG